MCTVIVLVRPGHDWPLLLAANRDEMGNRPWDAPARHWPDRPEVIAGRDRLAGGSWLGLNDHGVVACVLNRRGTLGPDPTKRTRGELVLEALDHADAVAAAHALAELAPDSYRGFHLVVADNRDAYWLKNEGDRMAVAELPAGFTMLTALDARNTPAHPRIARHLPGFEAAPVPDPAAGTWSAWTDILAAGPDSVPDDAMTIVPAQPDGYGTVSSALIALPALPSARIRPIFRFAAGRPGEAPYRPVEAV
ncbi:MAG TPA: NRDE family protein [Candidatus Sulfotelmatobacter sp.]|nr:NRDE family protein [Candidatus Sulfotelmatobacter sp.]